MERELDLIQYLEVIKKRWVIVIALPLVAALTSGIISYYVLKPVYQASTTLIVGKKASDNGGPAGQLLDYDVLLANQQLAKTYGTIAKSRTVEANVIQELKLPNKPEELDQKVTVNSVKDTEVLEIKVQDQDPNLAAQIANSIAQKFSSSVIEIKKIDSVSIVDMAIPPEQPIKPKKIINILLAFLVGMMTAVGLTFLLEYLDNSVKTTRDVDAVLGLPVLGVIPDYKIDKV